MSLSDLKKKFNSGSNGQGFKKNWIKRSDVRFINLVPGKIQKLRIVKGVDDEFAPFVSRVHFKVNMLFPQTTNNILNCIADDEGNGCPICDKIQEVRDEYFSIPKETRKTDKRAQECYFLMSWCFTEKYMWQVVNKTKKDGQVYILDATKRLAMSIIDQTDVEDEDGVKPGLSDFYFTVKKTLTGGKTEYHYNWAGDCSKSLVDETAEVSDTHESGGFYDFDTVYGMVCTPENMQERLDGTFVKKEYNPDNYKKKETTETKTTKTVTKKAETKKTVKKEVKEEDLFDSMDESGSVESNDLDDLDFSDDIEIDDGEPETFDVTLEEVQAAKNPKLLEPIYHRFPAKFKTDFPWKKNKEVLQKLFTEMKKFAKAANQEDDEEFEFDI